MNYLHGVETIEVPQGTTTVTEVKTAVIGLVGIAPTGATNVCTLVTSPVDAAQFGSQLPGFDIPQTLEHIFDQNAGTVVVVNVFDPTLHTTAVTAESQTVTNGALALSAAPIGDVTVLLADGTTPTTYIAGTDYILDEFGKLTVIPGRIPESTVMKFTYAKLNTAAITSSLIIGTVDGSGHRTGIQAFDLAYTLFGFRPKILIAPGRSATKVIADGLEASAERLRAVALIDNVYGDSVSTTLGHRADASTAFGTSAKRSILLYPYLKAYDVTKDDGLPTTDTNTDFPASGFYAGLMAQTDNLFGYWYSPSNKQYNGVTGIERPISANLNDTSTDTNTLNGAGITTVFNSFGTGFRAWGNRNASYPTSTAQDNFISVLRTFDVVHESLENAALQFIDLPITKALIDDIRQSGNNFIKILVGRGALAEGSKVTFDPANNPDTQLAAGQIVFTITKAGNSPAERITYLSVIDITLLNSLLAS